MEPLEKPPDTSVVGIVGANALTLAAAVWQEWGLLHLLWPFWIQSAIIGWYARRRILLLQQFSTDDLRMNNQPVEPTPETQGKVANFFALHYGLFHLGYLVFLVQATAVASGGILPVVQEDSGRTVDFLVGQVTGFDWLIFAALAFTFWRSHRASHLEHVEADLSRVPNVGTLMFMPYARVLPMHMTIILGASIGAGAVWLFVLLKTGADVVMHKIEHHVLQTAPRVEGV
jgi:hypothetical protein